MNIKHYKFVTEYLKWGDQVIAYKSAYNSSSSYKSLQSAANRLLNDPEVAKAIYESESRIRGEVEIAIANRQIKEILTIEEKRTLLKQIASGTMYVEQKYKGKNCTQCSQYISPTINQMLAAIREDNKLAGHYPYKQNGKWAIPAMQTEQEEEEIKSTLKNLQQNTTELENEIDNQPLTENNTDSLSLPFRGIGGKLLQDENTNPKNVQQITTESENEIDNQPLTEEIKTHETATVNTAGRIISQEQLRELLYPKKPKLSYMKNNP